MAGILDEFDDATPMRSRFCSSLTLEEYDKQSANCTEAAIAELINHLERNPREYHNVLKSRKREETEDASVFSYIKVKICSFFTGDDGCGISEDECSQKLEQLKESMIKSYNYSQESRGKRFSERLVNKRVKKELEKMGTPSRRQENVPPPPPLPVSKSTPFRRPPPPPPIKSTHCQRQGEVPPPPPPPIKSTHCQRQGEVPPPPPPPPLPLSVSKKPSSPAPNSLHLRRPSVLPKPSRVPSHAIPLVHATLTRRPLSTRPTRQGARRKQQTGDLRNDILRQIKGSECKKKLKRVSKKSPVNKGLSQQLKDSDHLPFFNTQLLKKFRNTQSPISSPTLASPGSFGSPLSPQAPSTEPKAQQPKFGQVSLRDQENIEPMEV